uniref:[histone H3]-lysine(4) N-methyltransferase n=1 Tax=Pygocentrus nattereri TaxID=42514 RepID=A0AAR2LIK6_PYGNA
NGRAPGYRGILMFQRYRNLEGTDVQRQDAGDSQVSVEQVSPIQRLNLSGANKRMLHLLKRAKVQLIKIDQQKQLKSCQVSLLSSAVRGEDGAIRGIPRRRKGGHPIGGPRIKHVCRAAAVALGQPRAMVPDDIPRLSALPLHEREGIAPSPNTEGSCSDPESTGSAEQKPVSSRRSFGLRQKRCFRCKGCCREEDCGRCVFCLDKPKYGGPNKKRQSCIYKKCARIEENKMNLVRFNTFFYTRNILKGLQMLSLPLFQEDCNIQNVWAMGGLSILTSIPITPEYVCLLCASKGHHEMIFCQMCCEPFHRFCLPVDDRPQKDNKENWCCRRCKYCHVCGRKSKHGKPVLQCKRCLYCYHPSCLGPTYPKPAKCNTPWVCMMCIRCKSCGVTPGKSWDMAWNHELNLCPQCSNLHSQGNFCTVCLKCYQEHEFDSKMMQCARCAHWVHPKCEGLTDDLYELLCRLRGKSLVFSCAACSKSHPSGWQEVVQDVLRDGLEKVMSGLLNSLTTCHLRTCSQVKFATNFFLHLKVVSSQLFLSPLPITLSMFMLHCVGTLKQLFILNKIDLLFHSGMLPEAIIPPSDEHSYAQWLEEQDRAITRTKETQENVHLKEAGRLLYLGQNEWAHVNCCIWSAEVQEVKGALLHVHSAVTRGRFMRCERCSQVGATVGCCLSTCQSNYHFMCARASHCVFQSDKKVYCHKHRELINNKMMNGFEVLRRVYVDFEGISLRRKFLTGLEPESVNVMIGSLQVNRLGVLSDLSEVSGKLYPVGYQCTRWYWSTVDPRKRCRYTCKVTDVQLSSPMRTHNSALNQEENCTIAHSPKPNEDMDSTNVETGPVDLLPGTPSPNSKLDSGAESKTPKHPQNRRPVGGTFRPLPSPGMFSLQKKTMKSLLNENVALHCGLYGSGAEVQEIRESQGAHTEGNSLLGRISDEDTSIYSASEKDLPGLSDPGGHIEVDSVDGDSNHYLNFSRTVVVCDAVKDSAQAGLTVLATSQSISQLDGADNDSESDASEASGDDDTQEVGNSYHSQETEPSKSVTPNSGRELVCTSTGMSFVPESIQIDVEPELSFVTSSSFASDWSSDEDSPLPFKQEQNECAGQNQPHLVFKITSDDGFSVEADSIEVAWKAVVDGVQEARMGYRLEQLPLGRMSGARVLGVIHDAVLFLLEQLQGAPQCQNHRFRFHQHEKPEKELPVNPSGCARAEVYVRKSTFDMFNFLASQHRQLPESRPCDEEEDDIKLKSSRRATSTELPMAMRFRHLEKTSKEAVGVYRSAIHGRGLFCKRNIEAGEMVIEYAGNVIRSVLTDKREKYYDSKGIGCYMFRIDDFDVVDATMHGNAARFINHSCEPNCYSRVINVEGRKHIVIFALRKMYRGEELTYDYKFPIEDASNKLHCNCGARRCRRFLN